MIEQLFKLTEKVTYLEIDMKAVADLLNKLSKKINELEKSK